MVNIVCVEVLRIVETVVAKIVDVVSRVDVEVLKDIWVV